MFVRRPFNHYEEKKSNEKNNSNLEEELLKEFKDSLGGTDYSKIVEASDIDSELDILKQVLVICKKHNIWTYLLVILFVFIYYIIGCTINGFEIGAPIFMIIIILPMMLVGGGNEEVGWRMILQPELEKKYGFNLATIFTAIIWWIWHLPLFFIKGTANGNMNYFLFGIMCLTLCYALATIKKVSKGVFPCILTHCLINGLSAIFVFNYSFISCCISLVITIIVSIIVLNMNSKTRYNN